MAKVIIFGIHDFAELAYYYLINDSKHEIIAFSVNESYLPEEKYFHELPIIPFEHVEQVYSPKEFVFFAPMSPKKMNSLREMIYNQIKSKDYKMISYISAKATIFNNQIGDNCFILENNTLQPYSNIGNNVILWSGNHIGHHSVIKDHVFFSSQVVLSGHCVVEPYCFIGVNASIRDGITLAEGSFIAMATSITKNTEPWSVYSGNPSKKITISSKDLEY
jgi:sugar O-acyltransferase (sialic acid O-acetyltransferase NeuD family)